MSLLRLTVILSCLAVAWHLPALGQTGPKPVGQDSGPLGELSTNVGAGSGPVRGSVGAASTNASVLRDRSVRGSVSGNVVSGPVSDISAGGVAAGRSVAGAGSVAAASVGAVKKDTGSPLGEMISQPLRELGPLQEQLRAIQPLPRTAAPAEEVAPPEAAIGASSPDVATQDEPTEEVGTDEAPDESEPVARRSEGEAAERADADAQEAMPPPTAAPTPQQATSP